LEHVFTDDDFTRENIKLNSVGQWLEKETAHWDDPVSSKRAYHTITRGWILNEIVRRVDPKSRTIGEIFHEDVMSKGMFCGLPEPEAPLVMPQRFTHETEKDKTGNVFLGVTKLGKTKLGI